VSDVDEAVAAIGARGGEISDRPHIVHRDGDQELRMAGLTDPDGNPVLLMEDRLASR
jgi:hypothetical protein